MPNYVIFFDISTHTFDLFIIYFTLYYHEYLIYFEVKI
jgi:hypothetical protein